MQNDNQFDPDRIHEIARRAGCERSLYIGEAIGNTLAIAWEGLAALGAWARRSTLALVHRNRPHPQ